MLGPGRGIEFRIHRGVCGLSFLKYSPPRILHAGSLRDQAIKTKRASRADFPLSPPSTVIMKLILSTS